MTDLVRGHMSLSGDIERWKWADLSASEIWSERERDELTCKPRYV